MLSVAIDDIGESVRANDAKASAALLLHGLIFAGVTTLLSRLGPAYAAASTGARVVGLIALGIAFAAFLGSAFCLIAAVSPYRARDLDRRLEGSYRHVFFPTPDILGGPSPHRTISRLLDEMGEAEVRDELVAETLKLAAILDHESAQTRWGYWLLRVELCATATFFVIVAIAAL